LLTGAYTKDKKESIVKIFDSLYGLPLNPKISSKAIEIMHNYITGQQAISVPDCLIAATALCSDFQLYTYNKKDFDFIDGINFYK
jgi:tRNA(fMet)-specific endonuclease VapC